MSDKLFKVPADWAKNSYVNQSSFEAKYKESINNNEKFWADEGKRINPLIPFYFLNSTHLTYYFPAFRIYWHY